MYGQGNISYNTPFGFSNAPGAPGANNGLSLSTIDPTKIVLGQDVAQAGDPAALLSDREVPQAGFALTLQQASSNTDSAAFFDTTAAGFHLTRSQATPGVATFAILEPGNYNTVYPSVYAPGGEVVMGRWLWGYAIESSGLPAGEMPDAVLNFGYNMNAAAARIDTREAGYRFGYETNFLLNLFGVVQPAFEFHLPEIETYGGTKVRLNSYYAGKLTGFANQQTVVDEHLYTSQYNLQSFVDIFSDNAGTIGCVEVLGDDGGAGNGRIRFTDRTSGAQTDIEGHADGSLFIRRQAPIGVTTAIFGNGDVWMNADFNGGHTHPQGKVRIGIYTGSVDEPTAQLQVDCGDTPKGFLPPRMSTVDKTGIVSPAAGLTVFDTSLNQLSYFNGTTWINL